MSTPAAIDLPEQSLKLAPAPAAEDASSRRATMAVARRLEVSSLAFWITAIALLFGGTVLRFHSSASMKGVGFDEILYRVYVQVMDVRGVMNYDDATQAYLAGQSRPNAKAELPPTRFLYIFSGYLWKRAAYGDAAPVDLKKAGAIDRDPALCSLRRVSALFSVLLMAAAGAAAWRIAGRAAGLGVLALMACAPLQIHMSQHAMIDGFLAFWATMSLWSLWENLRQPGNARWLFVYSASLVCLVLTKENAFFVFCALAGLLALNRWTKWGKLTRPLLLATFLAPLGGVVILVTLAGGVSNFVNVYRLLVANAQHLDYAIQTGDGPWYRYLIDLMVLTPVVLCLALAAAFRNWRESNWTPYVVGFVAISYAIMCNVRYGMNLRYATIWDFPLCLLAFSQIVSFSQAAKQWGRQIVIALVALLCVQELSQYHTFFVREGLYELGPYDLLHAVKILKDV